APLFRVTDGTRSLDLVVPLNQINHDQGSSSEAETGAGLLTFPAGSTLRLQTVDGGRCLVFPGRTYQSVPASNVSSFELSALYKMSAEADVDVCPGGQAPCGGTACPAFADDPQNCGACGTTCPDFIPPIPIPLPLPPPPVVFTAGLGSCRSGACVLGCVFPSTAGDCDGDPTNGCETFLGTTSNCGACGRSCTGGPSGEAAGVHGAWV